MFSKTRKIWEWWHHLVLWCCCIICFQVTAYDLPVNYNCILPYAMQMYNKYLQEGGFRVIDVNMYR